MLMVLASAMLALAPAVEAYRSCPVLLFVFLLSCLILSFVVCVLFCLALRVVVLGDIHGDYDNLIAMLRTNGVIDEQKNWVDSTTKVISLGGQSVVSFLVLSCLGVLSCVFFLCLCECVCLVFCLVLSSFALSFPPVLCPLLIRCLPTHKTLLVVGTKTKKFWRL